MSEIIKFPGKTYADIPADDVLASAMGKLSGVVLMGYTTDGQEYIASSISDGPQMVWLLERAKLYIIEDDQNDI